MQNKRRKVHDFNKSERTKKDVISGVDYDGDGSIIMNFIQPKHTNINLSNNW